MTNYQKILTSRFGSLAITVVKTGQSEPGITRQQLGEMLGYESPAKAIKDIHTRNAERFDGGAFCAQLKIQASAVRINKRVVVSIHSLREFVDGKTEPGNSIENINELRGKKALFTPQPPLALRRRSGNIVRVNCVGCRKKGED